jgi:hypothetical protein
VIVPVTGWLRLGVGLAVLLLTLIALTPTSASARSETPFLSAIELPPDLDAQAPWSHAGPVVSQVDDYAKRPASPLADLALPGSEIELPPPPARRLPPHTWHAGGAPHDIRHGFVATGPPA